MYSPNYRDFFVYDFKIDFFYIPESILIHIKNIINSLFFWCETFILKDVLKAVDTSVRSDSEAV